MASINIQGYQYFNESDAISAVTACNIFYNMPQPPTINWTLYNKANLDEPTFFYIMADDSLIPILGIPSEFMVTQPDLFC